MYRKSKDSPTGNSAETPSDYGSVETSDSVASLTNNSLHLPNGNGTVPQDSSDPTSSNSKTNSENGDAANSNVTDKKQSLGSGSSVHYAANCKKDNVDIDDSDTMQLVDRGSERELTNTEAILHLFKVFTGPSTIGMPAVIKNGGLLFGSIGFLVFGFLTAYGNILIVNCGQRLCKRTGTPSLRYEEVMELIVLSHSDTKRTRRIATIVRRITVVMLCLCQFGILAFYIQVIGTIAQDEFGQVEYRLPIWLTKMLVCILLVPYSWMKNLKILSWFSLLANISILICIVTILQYAIRNLRPIDSLPWITEDLWTIPLFISASVFTVEGVPMLLPIENRVLNPDDYGGICGVVTLTATVNIVINLCLGFYGYLSFGNSVPGNILTGLPVFWWYDIISIFYGLMVFLSYSLQLFLPAEFMVAALQKRIKAPWFQNYADFYVRTFFVIASYLLSILVSNVELIMSLTGALCSVPLLFIFPPIGELLLMKKEPGGIPLHTHIKDIIILIFGTLTFVWGTVISIQDIIERL